MDIKKNLIDTSVEFEKKQTRILIHSINDTNMNELFLFIGADIMMQLDDVVSSTITGPRVEEAMWRFDYLFLHLSVIKIFIK